MLTDRMHVKQTEFFVAQNSSDIVLHRRPKVDDGKGGFTLGPPATLPPQRMRRCGTARLGANQEVTTAAGRVEVATATLIAHPDCDIEDDPGDTFTLDGIPFVVLKVDRNPPWRMQAAIKEHRDG